MQLDPAGQDTYTFRSGSAAGFDTDLLESKVNPDTTSPYWNEVIVGTVYQAAGEITVEICRRVGTAFDRILAEYAVDAIYQLAALL